MKKWFLILALVAMIGGSTMRGAGAEDLFGRYFQDETLRFDYYRSGDSKSEIVSADRMYETPGWSGNRVLLTEEKPVGRHLAEVRDAESKKLIFSKSYDSIFGEYQSTRPALNGVKKTFQESLLLPLPKSKVLLTMKSRDRNNKMVKVFETALDPADYHIMKNAPPEDVEVTEFLVSGPPSEKVDLLFLAEGYRRSEREKFIADAARLIKIFFTQEPYKGRQSLFNIRGAFRASQESGITEPGHALYRRTALGCGFDSLDSNRYILTEDNRAVREVASAAPYDALILLVNTKRYGGGGIYNLYATVISDNIWTDYVFLHELGHSFTGLADEYYTSSTAYEEFAPVGVEPVEPNITALKDPENLKWKNLLSPGLSLPTPWEKAAFDKMDLAYQKVREELNDKLAARMRQKAPLNEIRKLEEEQDRLSVEHAGKVDAFLKKCRYFGKVGAFEGACYRMKGLYRPSIDCIMFSKGVKPFCPVCREAILKRMEFYTQK